MNAITYRLTAAAFLALSALPAAAAPQLVSGSIVTKAVNVLKAPAAASVSLNINAPNGVSQATLVFTSPAKQQYVINTTSLGSEARNGVVSLNGGQFSIFAQPGNWMLTSVSLADDSGFATYTAKELTSYFPSTKITVMNTGTPDIQAPTPVAGTVLTPVVSLGSQPVLSVSILATDNLSGVANVTVNLKNFQGVGFSASTQTTSPFLSGNAVVSLNMAGWPTGAYHVTSVSVCDAASNCVTKTGTAAMAAMFGNPNIKLTN